MEWNKEKEAEKQKILDEAEKKRKELDEIEKAIKDGKTEKEFDEEHKNANGDTSEMNMSKEVWDEIARKLKE